MHLHFQVEAANASKVGVGLAPHSHETGDVSATLYPLWTVRKEFISVAATLDALSVAHCAHKLRTSRFVRVGTRPQPPKGMKGAAAIDESGHAPSTSKVPRRCRRLRNVVKRRHSPCATPAHEV